MADLDSLLARLIQGGVEFVVVGGYAAAAHGVSLITQDIDICCPFTTGNLLRLQSAIADLHPVHRLTPQRIPLQLTRRNCARLKNLYLGTDLGPLDCLGEVLGLGNYEDIQPHTTELEFPAGPDYLEPPLRCCRLQELLPEQAFSFFLLGFFQNFLLQQCDETVLLNSYVNAVNVRLD